jgi:hypothetical protein
VPLPGDGRSGTFSTLPSQYGGYQQGPTPPPARTAVPKPGLIKQPFSLPYTETFTGANFARWPGVWTTSGSGGGDADIQSNQGELVSSNTAPFTHGVYAYLSAMQPTADIDVTTDLKLTATTEQYIWIFLRVGTDGSATTTPSTGYALNIAPFSGNSSIEFESMTGAGTYTRTGSNVVIPTMNTTTTYRVRFQAVGTTLRAKIWDSATSEPATWDLQTVDTSYTSGRVAATIFTGATNTQNGLLFDNFTVSVPVAGTDYTAGPADTAGLVDAPTSATDAVRAPAESAGLADTATSATDAVQAVADAAGLVDTATSATAFARAPADPAGLADAATPVTDAVRAVAEPAGLVDAAAPVADAVRAPAETAGLADTATATATVARAPADAAGLVDAPSATVDAARTVAETAALADAVAGTLDATRAPADTAGLADAVTATISVDVAAADALGITDQAVLARDAGVAETADLVDAAAGEVTADRVLADVAALADAVTATIGNEQAAADDLAGADDSSVLQELDRATDDALAATDAVLVEQTGEGQTLLSDPLPLSDAASASQTFDRDPGDALGATDAYQAVQDQLTALADPLGMFGNTTTALSRPRTVAEAATLTDSVSTVLAPRSAHDPLFSVLGGDDPITATLDAPPRIAVVLAHPHYDAQLAPADTLTGVLFADPIRATLDAPTVQATLVEAPASATVAFV